MVYVEDDHDLTAKVGSTIKAVSDTLRNRYRMKETSIWQERSKRYKIYSSGLPNDSMHLKEKSYANIIMIMNGKPIEVAIIGEAR